MRPAKVLLLTLILWCAVDATSGQGDIEARGKKKKIALFVYFADILLKKIFVLKLIYAFVFWIVIHKAGYFLSWFVSFLKEKKHEHHSIHHSIPHYHEHGLHNYAPSDYGTSSYAAYDAVYGHLIMAHTHIG